MPEKSPSTALVERPPTRLNIDPVATGRAGGIASGAARRKKRDEVHAMAEQLALEKVGRAIDVYIEAMEATRDGQDDHNARIAAADRLLNRLFGMPTQTVAHSGSIELDVTAARDKLAALMARRQASGDDGQA
jgi:hypothetical protein